MTCSAVNISRCVVTLTELWNLSNEKSSWQIETLVLAISITRLWKEIV